MPSQVVLFSNPGCQGCEQAKKFFNEQGIPFVERDLSTDENARTELQRKGIRATPVIIIDEQELVGFDEGKLKRMLQQAA
jgi:glutaredoxin